MTSKRILTLGLLLVATGCAVVAQNERRLTVDELFQLVEQGSKSLTTQRSAIEQADEAILAARDQRLPDISASASVNYLGNVLMTDRDLSNATAFSSPHIGNSLGVEAQQTIYAGGAIDANIRLAELGKQQAELGLSTVRNNERFAALGLYLDLYKVLNGQKVYQSNIALTNKLIDNIRAKHSQGMALKNDVTRYELQMESLELGLRRLKDRQSVINHQLCNVLGLTDVALLPDTTVSEALYAKQGEQYWQQRARTQSPLLQQTRLGQDIAEQQLALAKSELLPKVFAFAADNFSGPFTYDLPPVDKNFNIWYVGVGIRYSLSSLFKNKASVRKAKVGLRQSTEQVAVAEESVDNRIQEAYTLYEQAYADLRTRQKSVQLANQNYSVTQNRYLNQMALITDMIDASNVKLDAELQETEAKINIAFAYYKMKYLAGEL